MTRKSTTERISEVNERILQLENERKRLLQQQKDKDKKARTHRLIERGAILESLVDGAEAFTNEQIKTLLERTVGSTFGAKVIDGLKGQGSVVSAQRAEVTQGSES